MRIRNLALAVGLVAIAISLTFALLQNRTNLVTLHTDGTVTRTFDEDPILTEWTDFIDLACFAGMPCTVSAVHNVHGIYPRDGIPWPLGLLGGLVVPYGLICTAGCVFLAHTSGLTRVCFGCGLVVIAAILLTPLGLLTYRAIRYGQAENGSFNGVLFAVSVLGATTAAGAAWLFAVRPRMGKYPERA